MSTDYLLHDNTIHLWRLCLSDFIQHTQTLLKTLSPEEVRRVDQLKFINDKKRFIITRSILRKTLSLYTHINADSISFAYGEHGKPYLPSSDIDFNISHSHDLAIFAFAKNKKIGIDIQKMDDHFKQALAKRIFTSYEYHNLMQLDPPQQATAFYKLWSRKEALVKALGMGLFTQARLINLSFVEESQIIQLENNDEFIIQNISTESNYQAALSANTPINNIINWNCTPEIFIN